MVSQYCLFYLASKIVLTRADFYDWFQGVIATTDDAEIYDKKFSVEPAYVQNLKIVL
jgi:hypothetical protein|tara:strand:- start:1252 stop:1422 length:171 start_codon:yes stop_codon:yes gene_type:complete